MEPLFEVVSPKYFNVPCKEIEPYDGVDFPSIINELLDQHNGNIIFGGSSLLHDLFFKTSQWERDYDIWCEDRAYKAIKRTLNQKTNCSKIKEEQFEKVSQNIYYGRFQSKSICEFNYVCNDCCKQSLKIQLINVGTNYDKFERIINNVDLTINTVFYDGKSLIYVDTTKEDILAKKCQYRFHLKSYHGLCSCSNCAQEKSISEKEMNRIKKYEGRGFTIDNLCPLCEGKYSLSLRHCLCCLRKKMSIDKGIDFFSWGARISEDNINYILTTLEAYPRQEFILASLVLFLANKRLDLFLENLEKYKHLLNFYHPDYNRVLSLFVENGITTAFTKFYELIESSLMEYSNKRINQLFTIACKKNFINLARFIENKSLRCKFEIFEDKITSYKFVNIFEFYLEKKDPKILDHLKYIKQNEAPSEENCSICHTNFPNFTLNCNHRFCDSCIMTYFSIEDKKKNKPCCPMCRAKF